MRTSSADRVMQTMARYFEVQAEDADSSCPVEEAARRASVQPEFREVLARLLEEDCHRGSFSCVHFVGHADSGADAVMELPDGQVLAVQAKEYDTAGCDPEAHSFLVLVAAAAADVDRSSLGTAGAWALRRRASADDIAAVRKSLHWLGVREQVPAPPAAPHTAEQPHEPGAPDRAPDPLRASTAAELAAELARYRRQAGEPSYRDMARRSRPPVSASTLANAIHSDHLPTPRVVSAFVTGCGGGPGEVNEWATVLRRLSSRRGEQPEAKADSLAVFARDLRVLQAKARVDYLEMAERTHLSMRVLASAGGGLRLPPLPVLTAYVEACGGDVAAWETRWSTLASDDDSAPGSAGDRPAL